MSSSVIARAWIGLSRSGRWAGPIGVSRVCRFPATMPLWQSSMPASDPWACTRSTSRS